MLNYLGNLQPQNTDFRPFVWVRSLNDLPTPIDGVIYLQAGFYYGFVGRVDLSGYRLECLGDVAIQGFSSETSFLTSTGLGVGVPLITTAFSLPIQNISIHDVDTVFSISGSSTTTALDWSNFNLLNVPNVGAIGTVSNLVCSFLAFLNAANWVFTGQVGTLSFNNSIFQNFYNAPTFNLSATANITRRFRFRDCAFITTGTGNSIKVDALAQIPIDQFILRDNSFSGGTASHIVGRISTDPVSDWLLNKGIPNSQNYAECFFQNNNTNTPTGVPNVFVKILGTTTLLSAQRFAHSNNRLTYTGEIQRTFLINGIISVLGANNERVSIRIQIYNSLNALIYTSVSFTATTAGAGVARAENIKSLAIYPLNKGDYLEIWVASNNNNSNLNVTDLLLSANTI